MSLAETIRERRGPLALSLGIVVVDQLTKAAAQRWLAGAAPVEVVPGAFDLIYSRNPGGLFGAFGDLGAPWRTLLLTVVPLIAVGLVIWMLVTEAGDDRPTRIGLAAILGGAIGNLIDRVLRGEVIDFLDVYVSHSGMAERLVSWFGTAHWPTFNVADSAIVTGASLMLLGLLRSPGDAPETSEAAPPPPG